MSRNRIMQEVLTLAEAARYLRISQAELKKHVLAGDIPARQLGKDWRFLRTALNEWLRVPNSRAALLKQFGAFADDPSLPEIRKAIYAARGRPEVDEAVED